MASPFTVSLTVLSGVGTADDWRRLVSGTGGIEPVRDALSHGRDGNARARARLAVQHLGHGEGVCRRLVDDKRAEVQPQLADLLVALTDLGHAVASLGARRLEVGAILRRLHTAAEGDCVTTRDCKLQLCGADHILVYNLHVQQTPYPSAHVPELVPPLFSHSSAGGKIF